MAKVIKRDVTPPTKPVLEFTLILDEQEAAVLAGLAGFVASTGPERQVADRVFCALSNAVGNNYPRPESFIYFPSEE